MSARGAVLLACEPLRALLARSLSFPFGVALLKRLALAYARVALRLGCPPLPRGTPEFPSYLATLFGRAPDPAEARRFVQERFVFWLLNWIEDARPSPIGRRLLTRVEVRGREHLEVALQQNRGVLLVTGHFGFPPVISPVLDAFGARCVAVRGVEPSGAWAPHRLPARGGVWTRTRILHRMRTALEQNRSCVLLVDGGGGTTIRVPFFQRHLMVSLGAFALAQRIGCPLVPFFVVSPPGTPGFRVEIAPPLQSSYRGEDKLATETVEAFVGIYETYVRRYPGHLYWVNSEAMTVCDRQSADCG